MNAYLHGSLDYAKNLKMRLRVGDLDLPEGMTGYAGGLVEEGVDVQICPYDKAIQSRFHLVAGYELHKGERDV